ncbi:hypothetical protein [[Mycobacterium] burgundiense]|uniref:Uncharacterized protein n=1 Tax=[Mycobacterium] burgundiense TaxID=3064286 RepID=A0ABM9M3D4_9MYCO|nr:hypothetical protein [Mycolicibacterium sp. MU0053]CAJ1509575.1 hypothetical protein MU0053_004230 [Mycolicibacterium sp. MU0053]
MATTIAITATAAVRISGSLEGPRPGGGPCGGQGAAAGGMPPYGGFDIP